MVEHPPASQRSPAPQLVASPRSRITLSRTPLTDAVLVWIAHSRDICHDQQAGQRSDPSGLTVEDRAATGPETRGQVRAVNVTGSQSERVSDDDANALVGRESETLTASTLLTQNGVRLVTVLGQSGVGKTRLAREVAAQPQDSATLFVPLASVTYGALISDAIVDVLAERSGLRTRAVEAFWSVYEGDPVLLVLDNLEQIDGADEEVRDLLAGYPALRILATSLRPLEVEGERVLRLRAFSPVSRDDPDDPALTLFMHRARAADTNFHATPAILSDIADLCDEMGGLPLAIELAASRAGALPPGLVLEQLRNGGGLRLLRDNTLDREPRHASIAAAIQWSYLLLRNDVQAAFRRAAIFEAPFRLDAAHAVLDPAADPADILDRLSGLVDVQLLDLDVSDDDSRFTMPTLMRAFALERLHDDNEDLVRERHSRWFRARCSAYPENVRREWPDVAAALDTAVRGGHVGEALHAAVDAAPALTGVPGASAALRRKIDDLVAVDGEAEPALATRALLWGTLQPSDRRGVVESIGRWTSDRLTHALALARSSGDPTAVLQVLDLVVATMPTTLDVEGAVAATYEGLELASRGSDQAILARFEMYAAVIARQGGDLDAALGLALTALERARACGADSVETGIALMLLGLPADVRPDIDPALPSRLELFQACEERGQRREAVILLAGLSGEAMAIGQAPSAAAYLHRALELGADVETTDPFLSVSPVPLLALAALAAGDLESVVRLSASISRLEAYLRPALPPDLWNPYVSAVEGVRASVPERAYDAWAAEVGELTLPQINRHAQVIARRLAGPALTVTFPRPEPRGAAQHPAAGSELTPRQREVLRALSTGRTYREIGADLGMSAKTVMHHSAEIYRRLGVRGRGEATVWAFRHGLGVGGQPASRDR